MEMASINNFYGYNMEGFDFETYARMKGCRPCKEREFAGISAAALPVVALLHVPPSFSLCCSPWLRQPGLQQARSGVQGVQARVPASALLVGRRKRHCRQRCASPCKAELTGQPLAHQSHARPGCRNTGAHLPKVHAPERGVHRLSPHAGLREASAARRARALLALFG